MRCDSCGGDRFVPAEYNLGYTRAPAVECATCHVVLLDEILARSEHERMAIRHAIALRETVVKHGSPGSREAETVPLMPAALPVPDRSGTFRVASPAPPEAEEVDVLSVSKTG